MKRNLLAFTATLTTLLTITSSGVNAQEECGSTTDCTACLENTNDCTFAVGNCFDECMEPDTGATCYSRAAFDNVAAEDICVMYNSDNARCTSQRTCDDCTNTLKSDGNSCQWYAEAGDFGACFGGGEGPFGPGVLTCPTEEDDDTETEVPSPVTNAPTAASLLDQANCEVQTDCESCSSTAIMDGSSNCFWYADSMTCSNVNCQGGVCGVSECEASAESICQAAASDCETCIGASCAWFPLGACAPSCADLPADSDCYSTESTPGNAMAICLTAQTNVANRELCFAIMDCGTCTTTMKSDDKPCEWYKDEATGVEWCQTGGCDMNGICGSTTCDATVPETDVTTPAPVMDPTSAPVAGATEAPRETPPPADATGCAAFDGYGSDGCEPCLSSPDQCAWVLDSCVTSCDVIADAPCFAPTTFPDSSASEICAKANVNQDDVALCGSKNYCFTCTSTTKSDGTTCSWYTNGEEEWCDVGGCNSEGICGGNDESVCQQPEEPEPEPEPAQTPAPEPVVEESSALRKKVALTTAAMMLITMAWL